MKLGLYAHTARGARLVVLTLCCTEHSTPILPLCVRHRCVGAKVARITHVPSRVLNAQLQNWRNDW